MANMIRTAQTWLAEQMIAHLASQVVYTHGGNSATIGATFADSNKEVEDQDGIRIGATMVDFLLALSDFESAFGVNEEPGAGDRIVTEGRTFELLDMAGQGLQRWSGAPGVVVRVHTKEGGS